MYFCASAGWLNLDGNFPESLVLESGTSHRGAKRLSVEITCPKVRWRIVGPRRLVLSCTCIGELSLLVTIQCLLHDTIMNIHNISLYAPIITV